MIMGEYNQWEGEGTAEIVEFSAGLQTRQEDTSAGVFRDICAGHSPSNREK